MRNVARAFAGNPVFANIVLVLIFVAGMFAARSMTRETFPTLDPGWIQILVVYPGADPAEVEEGISIKIEEALEGVAGIQRLTTESRESFCQATVRVEEDYETRDVLDRIRSRISGITTFPAAAEKPIISDRVVLDVVLLVALSADLPERRLKGWAEDMKAAILDLPEVSQVAVAGARDFEISVEVTEEKLQAYGLTLAEVSQVIRGSSLNLPAGTARTGGEEVRLRTLGRKYTGSELREIVVRALPNGDVITLGQIADIRDGFAEDPFIATLDGKPGVFLLISKTPSEDSIEIANAVQAFVEKHQAAAPPGIHIDLMYDMSIYLRNRIQLLVKNGLAGLIFVFLLIWAFLDFRLSFWVGMGMPISIAGGLTVLWFMGRSINMISLFALIMVLGLVVDDAIVVGEAIFRKQREGMRPLQAAIEGLGEVGWPVLAGVTTTMLAFLPLAFLSGVMGRFIGILPIVVIACLTVSLVEVLLLFPAHLGHGGGSGSETPPSTPFFRRLHRARTGLQSGLEWFTHHVYAPSLERALTWRYVTLAGAVAACLVLVGAVAGGFIKFEFFGRVDGSIITGTVELPVGTPLSVTHDAVRRMEQAVQELNDRVETASGDPLVSHVLGLSGGSLGRSAKIGPHVGSAQVVLVDARLRDMHSDEFMAAWEEAIGPIAGVEALAFENAESAVVAHAIEIWLRGPDLDGLLSASQSAMDHLRGLDGVSQVERSFRVGKKEVRFVLKPEARSLGLTVVDLATQLRARYFGQEAVRIQRAREDVRVKVRYSAEERARLSTLGAIRVRTPLGGDVPLYSVATVTEAPGFAMIRRINGMRAVSVTAQVNAEIANTRAVVRGLQRDFFSRWQTEYPDIRVSIQGEQEALQESLGVLKVAFPLALVAIYVLIASVFRSYLQPVVILFTIPLGGFGALLAHWLLGLDLTTLSLFGMVALAGVAVNDAIVMIEAVNTHLAQGMPFRRAVLEGGIRRFRAVLLTTVTTVGGLAPLILETDFQAQFLIPMAVSIAGGELFGTLLTVILVPVVLYILNDVRRVGFRLMRGKWPVREWVEPARHRLGNEELLRAEPGGSDG